MHPGSGAPSPPTFRLVKSVEQHRKVGIVHCSMLTTPVCLCVFQTDYPDDRANPKAQLDPTTGKSIEYRKPRSWPPSKGKFSSNVESISSECNECRSSNLESSVEQTLRTVVYEYY